MSDLIIDDWQELAEDFKKLEVASKLYKKKLEEVNICQKECEKQINHQRYRISIIQQNMKKSKLNHDYEELNEEIMKREAHLYEIEQTLPKENDLYLKIILGNVNVSILNKDEKLKYKSEYEKFKLIISGAAFLLAVINLFVVYRLLERCYLFLLVWYYCTLTIRESILKVNGSKIKGWWRIHHFISTMTAAILLIWPESETWNRFRPIFMIFNAYLSIVQVMQFIYQKGVLYRLKALGERHNMDITIEGFHTWMWKGLSFLFPFLIIAYFFQLYIACYLYLLSYVKEATWHLTALSILFFTLFLGNITTMFMIIPDKIKRSMRLKYHVLSQRLWISTENINGNNKCTHSEQNDVLKEKET